MYPKIYLAIDNCFSCKRYTTPHEWAEIISGFGVHHVEASADTELDPLYMGREYLKNWILEARQAELDFGIKIASLFSGHGTYTTLGLSHTDESVKRRFIEKWFKPMVETAGALGASMGFYAHAFPESVLQRPEVYKEYVSRLEDAFAELNLYAHSQGCHWLAVEVMYSPQHYPWTINHSRAVLQSVTKKSGLPFYLAEDVGHHQSSFLRPSREKISDIIGNVPKGLWLGSDKAAKLASCSCEDQPALLDQIEAEMNASSHLFSEIKDGDCYTLLEELGCYCPIVHLQQTNGMDSSHLPFTPEQNARGIVDGGKLLAAIKRSYDCAVDDNMPRRTENIYLTLEIFTPTAAIMRDQLKDYKQSVEYWRQWVPQDGLSLDKLV